MRAFSLGLMIILFGAAASAAVVDTVRFDPDRLHIDPVSRCLYYDNIDNINDPGRPAVPTLTRIYHARGGLVPAYPSCRVLRADTLLLEFPPETNSPDEMTSIDSPAFSNGQPALVSAHRPGRPTIRIRRVVLWAMSI
jgi:hypothetical protein